MFANNESISFKKYTSSLLPSQCDKRIKFSSKIPVKDYNDQDFINEICTDWSGALPFTGIYDENLILLSHWEGKRNEAYFLKEIDSLLANKGKQL